MGGGGGFKEEWNQAGRREALEDVEGWEEFEKEGAKGRRMKEEEDEFGRCE